MNATELQLSFFQKIKDTIPPHKALVDEVAELLNISNDSAYRRIRGDKALTLDEVQVLSKHYKVSLDSVLHLGDGSIVFHGTYYQKETFGFDNYLKGIAQDLSAFSSAREIELFYITKDIPLFHLFMFPELAAFKCYFWSRYNLNLPQFNKGQFLIEDFIGIFNETGKNISEQYLDILSTEVWNLDCINTTIRQIDYYRESNVFKSKEDIYTLFTRLENLVDHIEKQAELGYKFSPGLPKHARAKYNVFVNGFLLGDNTILVVLDGRKMVFINHNVMNYIMTNNDQFIEYTHDTIQVLLKKSTLISEVGEKDRQLFFDSLRERIYDKKKLL
ncbi:MAG: hypothetical protein K0Q66_693 [Chitinophagaceae bacterium]|jgi:hypothetical protein|nr:hypothetical protein [Chitinophagaceae bacterium]